MKLVLCRCPECGQPLRPENAHIIVACENCGAAVHLGDEGLAPIEVGYAEPRPGVEVLEWRPFWIFRGQVDIRRRETQGGGSSGSAVVSGLVSRISDLQDSPGGGSGGAPSGGFWGQPRYLYVPAWNLTLKQVQGIGSGMIARQPSYQLVSRPAEARLLPVVLSVEDARKMIEFIVLAIEARRKDWLKRLEFELELKEPVLCALPANQSGLVALEKQAAD